MSTSAHSLFSETNISFQFHWSESLIALCGSGQFSLQWLCIASVLLRVLCAPPCTLDSLRQCTLENPFHQCTLGSLRQCTLHTRSRCSMLLPLLVISLFHPLLLRFALEIMKPGGFSDEQKATLYLHNCAVWLLTFAKHNRQKVLRS